MHKSDLLPPFPPWRTKVASRIIEVPLSKRKNAIRRAGFNTFLLKSKDVIIDLLTDSGTNAMYDTQRSAMELGDEAYAGSASADHLRKVIRELYGAKHIVPTHQGRAAEHLVSKILIKKPGQLVLSNMYFTTSRAHVEALGGKWIDVSIKEALDPDSLDPFKGNIDITKLESAVIKLKDKIAFIRIEACLNMAGGQPFSLKNITEVKRISKHHNIPLVIDATRAIENSYFIKTREREKYGSIKQILYKICHGADWIVVSAKKDAIVNIGGFLCTNDSENFEHVKNLLVLYEGFVDYGGLAGRDMEAIATGLLMAVDEHYIEHRVGQAAYFGKLLLDAGIPIVQPIGGHGVYLNAKKFLPHVPQSQYNAQALAASIYEETGIRGMERGLASAGRDAKTGKEHTGGLELVRLTIPRMVYSESHFAHAAEGIKRVFNNRDKIKGLKLVYEPQFLRFFQARFARKF
ncbi:MAG: Tyrosine phenol-lyase [Candidatus Giovannonibacteria bacterium GW2011_GWA2_44_13b]|uniref:Tyrosine phenol-lyase n=2 Tax=Candidatus Giovannoniibacteriota TaxID=1752738 RepID=A0A0G1H3Y2_9BACT|nr:MAG: Tyrosine phenol-lyase [Candidatus Giovannonibacteria bacterium GW2011_GWA2_44_13b]OGF81564.1 MAG: tyrosine phenol-lyase [Candidatus Giovannonibacteria bacterium RIFCSPLOWO2_01_FULL_44_16]